jgi:hypothetical protein
MRKNYLLFLFIFIFTLSTRCFALDQEVKQWIGFNAQQKYDNSAWRTLIFSQLRFTDQSHPLKVFLLEGGLGYQPNLHHSGWLGYRWSARNPYNDFSQENQLFQQYIYINNYISHNIIFRTRLEEITRSNDGQIALRLRQRFATELHYYIGRNTLPFIYDELFFQLNHPNYMPHTFLGENRLFLGVNLRHSQLAWWEIGYINQYQVRTPQQSQNIMSHVISVNYNFF